MKHQALLLLLFVIAAMAAGFIAGYRLRISEEHQPGRRYLPAVPAELTEYDGTEWAYLYPVPA